MPLPYTIISSTCDRRPDSYTESAKIQERQSWLYSLAQKENRAKGFSTNEPYNIVQKDPLEFLNMLCPGGDNLTILEGGGIYSLEPRR